MSYCVNCGVELDKTLEQCPLCNTPVINPQEMTLTPKGEIVKRKTPFPEEKGPVEMVKRKDMAILLTVFVVSSAAVCGLLNLLVFNSRPWSLVIIGACILLWVIMIPVVIYTRQPIYTSILLDGVAVIIYLLSITYLSGSRMWFWELGIPIVVLITVIAELVVLALNMLQRSFLTVALYVFTALAVFCTFLEVLIDRYVNGEIALGWSALVATICIILDITIITLLSRKRLRNEIRRRLHF